MAERGTPTTSARAECCRHTRPGFGSGGRTCHSSESRFWFAIVLVDVAHSLTHSPHAELQPDRSKRHPGKQSFAESTHGGGTSESLGGMSVLVPSPTPYPAPTPTPVSTSALPCGVGVIRQARMNEARTSAAPYDKEDKGEKGEKRAAESKVEQQPVKRACDQCHSRKVKASRHANWWSFLSIVRTLTQRSVTDMNRVDDAQRSRCCVHISTRPSRGARRRSEANKLLADTRIEADEGLQAQTTTEVTCCRAQQRSRSISALSTGRPTLRPWAYLVLHPSRHWAPIFVIGLNKRARTIHNHSVLPPSRRSPNLVEP